MKLLLLLLVVVVRLLLVMMMMVLSGAGHHTRGRRGRSRRLVVGGLVETVKVAQQVGMARIGCGEMRQRR